MKIPNFNTQVIQWNDDLVHILLSLHSYWGSAQFVVGRAWIWFDLIWFIHSPRTYIWQNTITYHKRKTAKTKLTRDSLVHGGFPRSELNHYLKGLRKPSWHNKKIKTINDKCTHIDANCTKTNWGQFHWRHQRVRWTKFLEMKQTVSYGKHQFCS